MWEKALEIASRVTLPIPLVAFALVFAAFTFWLALHSGKRRTTWMLTTVTIAIVVLGLAPLISSAYLQSRGVYRLSIEVVGPDGQPAPNADVSSFPAGEIKKTERGWELDLPPQVRPADHTIKLSAAVYNAFLAGTTDVKLADDYYPRAKVQLEPLPTVIVRGTVLDERGRPVSGATVAIEGYPELARTNEMGSFQIPSHYANRQMVTVIAQKGDNIAKKSSPAGDGFELVLRKP